MRAEIPVNNAPEENLQRHPFQPWQVINSREVYVAKPWLTVLQQEVRLPNGKVISDYHHIDMGEFAIIFAQTADEKVIVERQYKHGAGEVTLVLPAGSIEGDEAPLKADQRELLEETGYSSDQWQSMGTYIMHGNYGCGQAHLFRASQAEFVAKPNSGDLEDIEVVLMPLADLLDAVRKNEIFMMGAMATIALATNPLILPT